MCDGTVRYLVMALNKSQVKVNADAKSFNYQIQTRQSLQELVRAVKRGGMEAQPCTLPKAALNSPGCLGLALS